MGLRKRGLIANEPSVARRRGNVVSIGDSISAQFEGKDYTVWLRAMTGLSITKNGVAGVGTQYLIDHFGELVTSLSPLPDTAIVLIGTNDISGGAPALKVPYKNLIVKLLKTGILPVFVTLLPRSDLPQNNPAIVSFNEWLREYCWANGLIVADAYSEFADAAGLPKAGYLADGIHPDNLGGYKLAEVISKVLPARTTNQPWTVPNGPNIASGATFTPDTNADGLADGWTKSTTAGVTATPSLVAHPTAGNWQQLARSGGTDDSSVAFLQQTITSGFSGGDTIMIGVDVDMDASTNVLASAVFYPQDAGGTNLSGSVLVVPPTRQILTNMRFVTRAVLPASTAKILVHLLAYGSGTGNVRFGRVMVKPLPVL